MHASRAPSLTAKIILVFMALIILRVCHAADVVFDLGTFVTGPIANKSVKITPQSTPRTNSLLIISSDIINYRTDDDGSFTVTNMVEGNYLVEIAGPYSKTPFRILVPDTNSTIYARDLLVATNSIPSQNAGYSQAAANALFVAKLNSWSSNQFLTNAWFKGSTNVFHHTEGAEAGYLLTTDGTNAFWASSASVGEANTGTNLSVTNADVIGIFYQKSGVDFEFRTIQAGANIVITNQGTNIVIASTASGSGSGSSVTNLTDVGDVDLNSPSEGQGLIYDATSAVWTNRNLTVTVPTFDSTSAFTFDRQ